MSKTKSEAVKCKGCGVACHKKCASQPFIDRQLCDDCCKGSPKPTGSNLRITVDPDKVTSREILAKVNEKLEILLTMKQKLENLTESVDFYSKQYQALIEEKKKTDNKITALEKKNVFLEKCNKALEERVAVLELKEKECNVEICGLDMEEQEVLIEKVKIIAERLDLNPQNIRETKRVGRQRKERTTPPPVIVTLSSPSERDRWMTKKKERLYNNNISATGSKSAIYINEDITKYMRNIFWYAKNELKTIYKWIWIQNGKILARRDDENDKKIRVIRSHDDIKSLKAAVG
ncbi:hypothetical protein NE865_10644 [Phthorimaea operculella]|nr:hypothetical protein NE865_10644 [Phthorimaea operculella]